MPCSFEDGLDPEPSFDDPEPSFDDPEPVEPPSEPLFEELDDGDSEPGDEEDPVVEVFGLERLSVA